MVFEEEFAVPAPVDEVWEFFLDFESVARCIPGLEEFNEVGHQCYKAKIKQRISYLSVGFEAEIAIIRTEPLRLLSWETKGKANRLSSTITMTDVVRLVPQASNTLVRYESSTKINGKLATLGNVMIKAKAREVMEQFAQTVNARFTDERDVV